MVNPGLLQSPWSVAAVFGTGSIPSELEAILAEHSWTVRKDWTARTPKESTGQGLHAFLLHLELGEVPVPGLERVTLISLNAYRRVHLMHSIFSVHDNIYSTKCRLFACLGKLPAEGLPLVTEISHDFFAARRSVCAVPLIDHISHLGGISPGDWQTKSCDQAVKAAGTEHVNLACRGLAFLPADCAAWRLDRAADGPAKVFKASTGLFPLLTGREPPLRRPLTVCNSLILWTGRGLMWRLRPRSSNHLR